MNENFNFSAKTISDILNKMISYSEGNLHDIAHFLKVHSFAQTIALQENISPKDQQTLEIAAILHDIACPLCRKKYGNTNGKHQEEEGKILAESFLKDFNLPQEMKERIVYLVSHHHTYTNINGIDYQILLEADFLVNADESNMTKEAIQNAKNQFFKTKTGTNLLKTIYLS